MTRRIVSFTPSGAYVFRNVRRTDSNEPLLILDEGETTQVEFDLTKYLDTGETITAATVEQNGASVTVALASPKVTATVGSNTGYATITFTLSSGSTTKMRLHVHQRRAHRRDYAA